MNDENKTQAGNLRKPYYEMADGVQQLTSEVYALPKSDPELERLIWKLRAIASDISLHLDDRYIWD